MGFQSNPKLWKKDETAALIALFETERCLYDPNDRDFIYPDKQAEAYDRIHKIMLRIRPNVTVDEITYKIKVLRKQYEGELLHRNISIETGLSTKDSYKPGMWCFALLQFLDEFLSVKTEDEPNKNNDDSDKEICDIGDTDGQKNFEECSDANDESDDQEQTKQRRTCCKKRKVFGTSSSSSEREFHNSSVRKLVNSSSENKLKNSSFSVKKFQSSLSHEKIQNSSFSAKKVYNNLSSGKKIQKPLSIVKKSQSPTPSVVKKSQSPTPSVVRKSQSPTPSFRKTENSTSSHKKNLNSSPFIRNLLDASSSEKKVPSSSKYENRRKSSCSSDRELDDSSIDTEMKDQCLEDHIESQSSEKNIRNSFSAAKEARINSYERDLFDKSFSAKEFDVASQKVSGQNSFDREDMFGRYVASELRALRCHPIVYLQTKQCILESLNNAEFELLNPE